MLNENDARIRMLRHSFCRIKTMPNATANLQHVRRKTSLVVGAALFVGGLLLDYLLERDNIFKVLENSPYPISWSDFLYPPICVLLSLTGIILPIGSLGNNTFRGTCLSAIAISIPLTVLYSFLALGMQFVATGADRLGECPGLDEAAASSSVIPESSWRKGAAVGCAVERRGIFLSSYNDIDVYGVTDRMDQMRVLQRLTEQYRRAHTHPLRVRFFEKENIFTRKETNGVVFQKSGPVKLVRVVNIG